MPMYKRHLYRVTGSGIITVALETIGLSAPAKSQRYSTKLMLTIWYISIYHIIFVQQSDGNGSLRGTPVDVSELTYSAFHPRRKMTFPLIVCMHALGFYSQFLVFDI